MRLLIRGAPGAGKTTELIKRVSELEGDTLCFSFSKAAARELTGRNSDLTAATIHSECFHLLGMSKTEVLTEEQLEDFVLTYPDGEDHYKEYITAMNNMQWDDFKKTRFADDFREYKRGLSAMDFYDMLHLAYQLEDTPRADNFVLDEAQDCSKLLMAIFDKWSANAVDVIVAGDPDQSIMEFAGADTTGMTQWRDKHGAHETRLYKSHRVPEKIGQLASRLITKVEKREHMGFECIKKEGVIEFCSEVPKDSDVVLCRTNEQCKDYQDLLLAEGYAVRYDRFADKVSKTGWVCRITERYKQLLADDVRWDDLKDSNIQRIARIGVTKDNYGKNPGGILINVGILENDELEMLRNNLTQKPIEIRTMHSSKGKEWGHVCIVDDFVSSEEYEHDAEHRLAYVAVTRAMNKISIIRGDITTITQEV